MPLPMAKKRTDAERRIRQGDRLARILRLLQLIQGPGNWNAQAIAEKLDCSERTVYRDLQVLTAAGIPWYFDEFNQSYRIRDGYRGHILDLLHKNQRQLPEGEQTIKDPDDPRSIVAVAKEAAQRLLVEAEGVVQALDRLSQAIEAISGQKPN
jgi:predicted DNA-binding transcriptional regulator YafY